MTEKKDRYIQAQFAKEGLSCSEQQIRQFDMFYEMLTEKNKVMNLTGITEFPEVVEKHFLDSLSLCRVIDLHQPLSVLDLGTGAGFPGIPLKIVFPELSVTLMDSLQKRVRFLHEVIEKLGFTSIEAVHGRAEEYARNSVYRESFDLCVSRAVANLSVLAEYCLPFVKTGGRFAAYKSGSADGEAKEAERACSLLGGRIEEIYKFDLGESKRSFILIKKIKKTPGLYPRKAGTPVRSPL